MHVLVMLEKTFLRQRHFCKPSCVFVLEIQYRIQEIYVDLHAHHNSSVSYLCNIQVHMHVCVCTPPKLSIIYTQCIPLLQHSSIYTHNLHADRYTTEVQYHIHILVCMYANTYTHTHTHIYIYDLHKYFAPFTSLFVL